MTITLEQARLLSVAEITGLSAQDLMQLQSAVAESLRQARDLKEWIDGAIALKHDPRPKYCAPSSARTPAPSTLMTTASVLRLISQDQKKSLHVQGAQHVPLQLARCEPPYTLT